MSNIVQLSNVYVAGNPTFFPHNDPSKHRTILTAIHNSKTRDGRDIRDEYTLVFWGKYAQMAALYLKKGRCINVMGRLKSHSIDTGRVKANGKREIYRITTVHVDKFEFGRDSMKELSARINANIQRAKAEGLLPPNCTVTAEYLLHVDAQPFVDYNPAVVAQTGMYGNARVFIKGQGFLGPQTMTQPGAPAAPTAQGNEALNALEAQIRALQEQLAQANQGQTAPVNTQGQAVATPDPFAM